MTYPFHTDPVLPLAREVKRLYDICTAPAAPDDAEAAKEGLLREMSDLMDRIADTPAQTIAGAAAKLRILIDHAGALEDGDVCARPYVRDALDVLERLLKEPQSTAPANGSARPST